MNRQSPRRGTCTLGFDQFIIAEIAQLVAHDRKRELNSRQRGQVALLRAKVASDFQGHSLPSLVLCRRSDGKWCSTVPFLRHVQESFMTGLRVMMVKEVRAAVPYKSCTSAHVHQVPGAVPVRQRGPERARYTNRRPPSRRRKVELDYKPFLHRAWK